MKKKAWRRESTEHLIIAFGHNELQCHRHSGVLVGTLAEADGVSLGFCSLQGGVGHRRVPGPGATSSAVGPGSASCPLGECERTV